MSPAFKTKHAVVGFAALAAHTSFFIIGVAAILFYFFLVITSDVDKLCTMYLLCGREGRTLLIFLMSDC